MRSVHACKKPGAWVPIAFLCCSALPCPGSERPQEPSAKALAEMDLEELLKVRVISSTRVSTPIQIAPSTIYRYSGEELRRWGMQSLADVVNYLVPGAVLTEDADETIAAFRGVATDNNCKLLVLIDGHSVNPQWAKGATPELELGLLEEVERVEIIVGPGSALYGSGATVGVLSVITRTYKGRTQASAVLGAGSGKLAKADSVASFPLGEEASMTCSAGILHADGFPRRDGSPRENWPEYIQRMPLNARAFIHIQDRDTDVAARFTRTSRAIYNSTVAGPGAIAPYEYLDYIYLEGQRAFTLSPTLRGDVSLHFDTHESQRFDFDRGTALRALGERHVGGKAHLFWEKGRTELATGLEFSHDSFGPDWNGNNFTYYPTVQGDGSITGIDSGPASRVLTEYNRNFFGLYGQAVSRLWEGVTLLVGFRADYVGAPRIRTHSALTPRLGLVGAPSDRFVWKLMYTTGFRQAMGILTTPDGYLLGSPKYSSAGVTHPERIKSLEGSLSYLLSPRLNLTANVYYNRMDNVHSLVSSGGQSLFVSTGDVDFMGGELTLWYKVKEKLNVRVIQQTTAPGRRRVDPYHVILDAQDDSKLMYYPQNVTKFLCDWQITPWLSANASGLRVAQQRGYVGTARAASDAYTLVNFNLVIGNGRHHELRLELRNLLDADPKVPMPGAPGVGTNMVPLAGRRYSVIYRRMF